MATDSRVPGAMTRWVLALLRHLSPLIQEIIVWALLRFAWFLLLVVILPVVIVAFAVATTAYAVLNAVLGSPSGGVGAVLAYGWLGLWVVLTVVMTVRIWHSIPFFMELQAFPSDAPDLRVPSPGDTSSRDRRDDPPDPMPAGAPSDEHLRHLEDQGGELTVYEPVAGATMILASRGRRRGSTDVGARIPTRSRGAMNRPRATHAGLMALGWKADHGGSLVRTWTIVDAPDRATVRRDVNAALDALAADGHLSVADLAIAHQPLEATSKGAFEAGCLLSIAGSFIGAVGGLVALALLTTAVESAEVAIVAFILAFVGGFIIGMFGAWPAMNLAFRIEPLRPWRDELLVLWSGFASGLAAAAIPWLLARMAGVI